MHSQVADPCRKLATNDDTSGTHRDNIDRTHAQRRIANSSGGKKTN